MTLDEPVTGELSGMADDICGESKVKLSRSKPMVRPSVMETVAVPTPAEARHRMEVSENQRTAAAAVEPTRAAKVGSAIPRSAAMILK